MKKIWHSLKTIVYSYAIQFIVCILAIILYVVLNKPDVENLNEDLMFQYLVIGITCSVIPIAIYILKKYPRKESKINIKKLLLMIPLGFGLSWFCNMLTINFQEPDQLMNLNIIVLILYTVILGPVFEELVFRYMALHQAEEVYSKKNALLIISISFALLHTGLIGMLYAFIIGLVLGKIYQQENNILYPIVMHMSANLASTFVTEYNLIFLIVSIILLGVTYYLKKELTN